MSQEAFDATAVKELMSSTQLICSNMNIGLLMHHVADPDDLKSIRFIYANDEASKYTGTDLSKLLGKPLHEAFPGLSETEIPETFAEVVRTQEARTIGVLEYQDENVKQGFYSVKAFPLSNNCVGVAFENVTGRKQMERMIEDYTRKLRQRNEDMETLTSRVYNEVGVPLKKISVTCKEVQETPGIPESCEKSLAEVNQALNDLGTLIDKLVLAARGK